MKPLPAWLPYTFLRIVALAVPLAILLLVGLPYYVATPIAVVVGLCVSYIFLRRPREAMSAEIHDVRTRGIVRSKDDVVEDDLVDAADRDDDWR